MTAFITTELARQAADRVYTGLTSVPLGWEVDTRFGDGGQSTSDSGGYVYALKPLDSNDTRRILAFRGTEVTLTNMKDVYADVTDIGRRQFTDLRNAVNSWLAQQLVAGNRVELVGHSLGGALVQWAINDTNKAAVTNVVLDPEIGLKATIEQFASQLHFTTFNAPGISRVLGGVPTDRTSVVVGDHHVAIGALPYLQGDVVHLLGGPPMGGPGSHVVAHRVDFSQWGSLLQQNGIFAHTVTLPQYWEPAFSPVVVYAPRYLDAAVAQSFAANFAKLANTDGTVDGNLEAMARLGLFALASGVGLGANTVALAAELAELSFDRTVFANTVAAPVDGINRGLVFLTETAAGAGQNVVDFSARLSSGFVDLLRSMGSVVSGVSEFITETVESFLVEVAQGIRNAVAEVLHDVSGTLFNLGRTLTFTDVRPLINAYEGALEDPRLDSSVRTALEDAQQIVQRAGQTVVIQTGIGPNPFDTTGFNPDTASPATVMLNEGQQNALTIHLPFDAGVGGQKLTLTLSGPNAHGFVLRTNGIELSPNGSTFTLTIPEGQQQLVVGLKQTQDIGTSSTLTVTAQLVDAHGAETHASDQELTIALADTGELLDGRLPAIHYDNGGPIDIVMGTEGADIIGSPAMGASGLNSMHLVGLGGHDQLTGGAGNDEMVGGEGSDWIRSQKRLSLGAGDDRLDGGAGDDVLVGNHGRDVLRGGEGRDGLIGDEASESSNDYLDGGDDADELWGKGGDDVLLGGTGDDHLLGDDASSNADRPVGADYLDGGAGADVLLAGLGDDQVRGGGGNDRLYGDNIPGGLDRYNWSGIVHNGVWPGFTFAVETGARSASFSSTGGTDFLDGGEGDDLLQGDGGGDVLLGGAGADELWGDDSEVAVVQEGDDWLEGGAGNDQLVGGGGADTLSGGDQADTVYGDYVGNATLGANDMLNGGAGSDTLYGGGGQDLLDGGADDDVLYGEEGDDELYGGAGADHLHGGEGHDTLIGEGGADALFGDAGDDVLVGEDGADHLIGGAGLDELAGGAGDDVLFGDEDNDTLFGDAGQDQLQGGAGNDLQNGGTGSDRYVFNLGDGHDVIFEEDVVGDVNTILFGAGITSTMLTSTHDAVQETLRIQIGGGADSILIHGFTNTGVNGTGGMQNIAVGGVSYSLADLVGLPSGDIIGTSGNDVIATGAGADTIDAGGGNDRIRGNGGNDLLIGGVGHDTYLFTVGDGLDTIHDTALIGEGNRIVFDAGITAANLTYTHSPNRLTISYNGASDAVQLVGFNQNTVLGSLVASTLQFSDNSVVNLADLFPMFTNHLPTVANPLADQTAPEDAPWTFVVPANTFADQDLGDVLTYRATLADGSVLPPWLSFDPITRTFTGTPDDAHVGTISLRITATDPRHATVSDTFNLTITSVNEAPTVANPLADQAATKEVPFSFVLPSGAFADVDAGETLTYRATLADNTPLPAWLTFNPFTRTFSGTPQMADVGTVNVKVTARDSGTLGISDVFTLTVAHGLNELTGTSTNDNLAGTAGHDLLRGLSGNDTLRGLDGNDTLEGGDGNDQLYGGAGTNVVLGGAGADRLEGYTGNDTFQGGSGDDTFYDPHGGANVYLFGRGDGRDTIYADSGTIRFATGILPTDITVRAQRGYPELVLSINGTTDQIGIFYWTARTSRIDRVEFADGTVWNGVILQAMASAGTAADDYLSGTTGNDVLSGLSGNDVIEAYSGDDVLDGGPGNDTLSGFDGNDTYVFGRGYGLDRVQTEQSGMADAIQLTAGILPGDVTLQHNGTKIILSLDQSATQLMFGGIELIRFHDGTTWDAAAMASHTFVGTINSMTGTTGHDTFVVDHAHDTVVEGANQGTDTIQSRVSYTLPSHVENLTLTGYFSVDGTGNALDNVIIGNSGNNALAGSVNDYYGGGNDTLQGGAGDDTYTVVGNYDVVMEAANEGIDSVTFISYANYEWTYTIPDNVENVTVQGARVSGQYHTFFGNALNNIMTGDPNWFNFIDGGLGADTMVGSPTSFSDTYVVDNPGDVVVETGYSQDDLVVSSVSYALGPNLERLTLTGTSAINGTGNELNNVLTGNSAANVLTGGAGDDTYVIGVGDTIVELPGHGIDTVSTDQSYTLGANVENVNLTGTDAINATGNAASNVLTGNRADNVLDGGAGADQLIGGDGHDTYLVGAGDTVVEQLFHGSDTVMAAVTFTLSNELEHLTLMGTAAINGTGNVWSNVLTGNSGVNILTGGNGDDTYVVSAGDTIVENESEGTDTVYSDVTWTLGMQVENLTLTETAAINGTGNARDNVLEGNRGSNILTGGAGDDTYVVDGTDTIVEWANEGTDTVLSAETYVLSAHLEQLTLIGDAAVNGTGNAQDNLLIGNSSANVLDGGAGADTMVGDAGDDRYVVNSVGDVVTENAAEGTDTVQSLITYTLGANVEHLTLLGTAAINGTGNALNNMLTGNSAANVFAGGAGNDTYVVGAGDTVSEAASAGTDTVQSAVTWTLGSNIENLTLLGAAAINATGNTLNNTLAGNAGNNVLDGGAGNDTMGGGLGNDTYVVNATGDVVTENANEGSDTVQSSVTWTLGVNLEHLTLTGTTISHGTGNTLDNVLTGNSAANTLTGGAGNDTLDGGLGSDTLRGGTGNDTYVVNTTGDLVTEYANEGTDRVQSSVTWALGTNLEHLTLTGTSAINGTGNASDNVLVGNSAANILTGGAGQDTLDGGLGNDTLRGGTGNDTYVVNTTGDSVTEYANEGTDLVQSSVTWTLGANLENLTLSGTSVINGTGNGSTNTLAGNSANNVLTGLGGSDTYLYSRGGGQDTVVDHGGTADRVRFGVTLNPWDLVLSRQVNDLRVAIHGSTDRVTIQHWYSGTTNQVETIQAGNGQTLLHTQVNQLIQAMASFSQQTGLTWDQALDHRPQDVQAVLAASWQ